MFAKGDMRQTTLGGQKKRRRARRARTITPAALAIYDMKKSIGKRYGNVCFVCGIAHTPRRQLVIHHLWYLPGESTYKDFARQSDYLRYLAAMVQETPGRFILVCNRHHQSIERLKRFNKAHFERLAEAVRMTGQPA